MRIRNALLASAFVAIALQGAPDSALAQTASEALTGHVGSAAEASMEGVLVSARREGTTMTISVVSDASGRYSFPAARLAPGRYTLAIRAIGYELDGPRAADVTAGATASADIKLRPAGNLSAQLTNSDTRRRFSTRASPPARS